MLRAWRETSLQIVCSTVCPGCETWAYCPINIPSCFFFPFFKKHFSKYFVKKIYYNLYISFLCVCHLYEQAVIGIMSSLSVLLSFTYFVSLLQQVTHIPFLGKVRILPVVSVYTNAYLWNATRNVVKTAFTNSTYKKNIHTFSHTYLYYFYIIMEFYKVQIMHEMISVILLMCIFFLLFSVFL